MEIPPQSEPDRKCSFCEATPAVRTYLAAPALITLGKVTALICDPDWDACATCASLIDRGNWEGLAQHVLEAWANEFRAKGASLDFDARDRLKRTILEVHRVIREAMGRTA